MIVLLESKDRVVYRHEIRELVTDADPLDVHELEQPLVTVLVQDRDGDVYHVVYSRGETTDDTRWTMAWRGDYKSSMKYFTDLTEDLEEGNK